MFSAEGQMDAICRHYRVLFPAGTAGRAHPQELLVRLQGLHRVSLSGRVESELPPGIRAYGPGFERDHPKFDGGQHRQEQARGSPGAPRPYAGPGGGAFSTMPGLKEGLISRTMPAARRHVAPTPACLARRNLPRAGCGPGEPLPPARLSFDDRRGTIRPGVKDTTIGFS